jgi:hypothetical protein
MSMNARFLWTVVVSVVLPVAAYAQGFTPYPGATPDQAAADAAMKVAGSGTRVGVYLTGDPFEKVAAFYRALYKETKMPGNPMTLPNGAKVKWAFFILDGAKDLSTSKSWMKVQRPYIGDVVMQGPTPQFKDIRDVTVIETVQKM